MATIDEGRTGGGVGRFAVGAVLGALGGAAWLAAGTATAADHRDSPSVTPPEFNNSPTANPDADPRQDINDIYAFMNPNPDELGELVLVMTVVQDASPEDRFSTTTAYDFLIESSSSADPAPFDNFRIRCSFPTEETVSCSLGDRVVTGQFGQTGSMEGFRVYTGLHEDPFFFNGPGLDTLLPEDSPTMASGDPTEVFDAARGADGSADSFAGQNTLALVIGVDRDFLTADQTAPILKIWAATSPL